MKSNLLAAVFLLVLPGLVTAQAGPPRPAPGDAPDTLSRIQSECLRAWSPDLLYDVTGSEEIPAKALTHGNAQMELFTETAGTAQGAFYPSQLEDLRDALEQYIRPGTRFLDLGSGDGRVVFLASVLGANAVGYESDRRLFEASLRARNALGGMIDPERARIVQGDYYDISWSDYDVIFYYEQGSDDPLRLRRKIFSELAPNAVFLVEYPQIPFPGLVADNAFEAVTVYRQPKTASEAGPRFLAACEKEIESLHRFLQDWFNGRVGQDDAKLFRFTDVLVPGFRIVTPDGHTTDRQAAINAVRAAWGSWRNGDGPEGRIRIENFELRFMSGHVAVVTYDEWQEPKGPTGLRQGFKTTAVMQLRWGKSGDVEWLHLHQTAID